MKERRGREGENGGRSLEELREVKEDRKEIWVFLVLDLEIDRCGFGGEKAEEQRVAEDMFDVLLV